MVFSSPVFLFGFLPVALGLYHLVPTSWRNGLLIGLSACFYIWGAGAFILVLLTSALVDWLILAPLIERRDAGDERGTKRWLVVSILVDLSLLGACKYAGFVAATSNRFFGQLGRVPVVDIVVPLALSFFTFQRMSIAMDSKRGLIEKRPPFADYLLVTSFFPHLIAGPIVRWRDMASELHWRDAGIDDLAAGALRFSHGLAKKLLIADQVAPYADRAFTGLGPASPPEAWLGVLAFTVQIYFDFSGYTDMAIGLGRMFGFRFPENFNRPYSALSVSDFWRRWHMTLSGWFRDYLYVPLGGSRGSAVATSRNLAIVFLLTGLWHGAAVTFLAWGAYHGAWLLAERALGQRTFEARGVEALVRRAVTFLAVVVGWVLFRASGGHQALQYLKTMFTPDISNLGNVLRQVPNDGGLVILVVAALGVVLLPRAYVAGRSLISSSSPWVAVHRVVVMVVVLPAALVVASASSFTPFLYFQF